MLRFTKNVRTLFKRGGQFFAVLLQIHAKINTTWIDKDTEKISNGAAFNLQYYFFLIISHIPKYNLGNIC